MKKVNPRRANSDNTVQQSISIGVVVREIKSEIGRFLQIFAKMPRKKCANNDQIQKLTRNRRILNMAINQKDKDELETLSRPSYESTKSTTTDEKNLALQYFEVVSSSETNTSNHACFAPCIMEINSVEDNLPCYETETPNSKVLVKSVTNTFMNTLSCLTPHNPNANNLPHYDSETLFNTNTANSTVASNSKDLFKSETNTSTNKLPCFTPHLMESYSNGNNLPRVKAETSVDADILINTDTSKSKVLFKSPTKTLTNGLPFFTLRSKEFNLNVDNLFDSETETSVGITPSEVLPESISSNLEHHYHFTRSVVNSNSKKNYNIYCIEADTSPRNTDIEMFEYSSDDYIPPTDNDSSSESSLSSSIHIQSPLQLENEFDAIDVTNNTLQTCSTTTKNLESTKISKSQHSTIAYANINVLSPDNATSNNNMEVSSGNTANSDQSQITYSKTKRNHSGKRLRNKIHSCYVCHKLLSNNMARHFELIHGNDIEIAKILILPKGSQQRREEFEKLIRVGDFYYNCEVLNVKQGELLLVRSPDENKTFTYNDFGPCPSCLGFMLKKYLWHHVKVSCKSKSLPKSNDSGKRALLESNALLFQICGSTVPPDFSECIISCFRSDEIALICKEDSLIVNLGAFLFQKYGSAQKEFIRQCMRQLGRLLLELNKINGSSKLLNFYLTPTYFDSVVTATRNIAGSNYKNINKQQEFDTPSLALKLGYLLRKCVAIERGSSIRKGILSRNTELENFLMLMNLEWSVKVSSNALSTMYKRKMNAKQLLPLTSDLKKLTLYLDQEIEKLMGIVTNSCSRETWTRLASVTLSKIILFNKRRSGEASRMTIENYSTRPSWSDQGTEELKNSLSHLEQELAKTLNVVEIMGKRGRKVPVIITNAVKRATDLLLRKREEGEILVTNRYIFARAQGSSEHLRGHDCLRRECYEAGIIAVENITSTKLRKYTATVCQIFNLKEHEMDWLARHLGHDIRVHREFYRLHESAVEVAKISRLLLTIDKGEAQKFSGKSLEDINMEELPDLELESDDETDPQLSGDIPLDEVHQSLEVSGSPNDTDNFSQDTMPLTTGASSVGQRNVSIKKRTCKKSPWSAQEKKCVLSYFASLIKRHALPGKKECEICIEKHEILKGRKWTDLKFCIKNHFTKISKLK